MSVNVMPIGGKYENDGSPIVTGVAVDESGSVISGRKWRNQVVQILEASNPTAGTLRSTSVDLSDVGAVSLRINNALNVPIELGIYADYYGEERNYYMRDADGNVITKTVGANKNCLIITPDDVPVLQWLEHLRLGVKINGDSITGTLSIWAVLKG